VTLHGAGGHQLRHAEFDAVIIDEASQALEAQCWVPLLSAKKAILAGDHLQLPPTIKSANSKGKVTIERNSDRDGETGDSKRATNQNVTLEVTLFDRLIALHGQSIKRMLTTQYRMHEKIMAFPSEELYDSKLIAADAVKSRLLVQLPGMKDTEDTNEPLVFYDTQGGDFPERAEDEEIGKRAGKDIGLGESKSNEMEASVVALHVKKLVEAGLKCEEIAVITPYNAQVS